MHEMALVCQLVDIVQGELEGRDVERVACVRLTVGELMDVVDELVPGLFRYVARGTAAQDAEVVIRHAPAYVQCRRCNDAWHIDVRDEATWTCPRCGAYKDYRLVSGREFRVDSIEVELAGAPRASEGQLQPA